MNGIDEGRVLELAGSRVKPMTWLAVLMGIPLLFITAALGTGHSPIHAATPEQADLATDGDFTQISRRGNRPKS